MDAKALGRLLSSGDGPDGPIGGSAALDDELAWLEAHPWVLPGESSVPGVESLLAATGGLVSQREAALAAVGDPFCTGLVVAAGGLDALTQLVAARRGA